jgi:hypothetical protein
MGGRGEKIIFHLISIKASKSLKIREIETSVTKILLNN